MKNLLLLSLALLGSCASIDQAPFRAGYLNYSSPEFAEDDAEDFDATTGEIGLMYGGGEEATSTRAVGLVGDIALSGLQSEGEVINVLIPGVTSETIGVDMDAIGARTGLRYYFDSGSDYFQPFLGGGLLVQYAWFDAGGGDKDDSTALGFSGIIGLDSQVSQHVRLGVGYQFTSGMEYETDGVDIDLDRGGIVFSVGVSF